MMNVKKKKGTPIYRIKYTHTHPFSFSKKSKLGSRNQFLRKGDVNFHDVTKNPRRKVSNRKQNFSSILALKKNYFGI